MTPLMFASREGNLRVLKYLIELTDINIDQQDENGWTVIIKSSLFRSFYLNDLFRVLFTRAIKAILNVYVSYWEIMQIQIYVLSTTHIQQILHKIMVILRWFLNFFFDLFWTFFFCNYRLKSLLISLYELKI